MFISIFCLYLVKQNNKTMRTQLDDLNQELRNINKTLMFKTPNETKNKLLKRAEIIRSIIFNIQ